MKRKLDLRCPHCGADLTKRADKPSPDGPSIGRVYSRAEIENEIAEAKQPKRVQFKG
jgi:hypothetical protein